MREIDQSQGEKGIFNAVAIALLLLPESSFIFRDIQQEFTGLLTVQFECYFMFKRFHLFVNWRHTNSYISSGALHAVQAQLLANERLLRELGPIRLEDLYPKANIMDRDHIQSKNNRRRVLNRHPTKTKHKQTIVIGIVAIQQIQQVYTNMTESIVLRIVVCSF